MAKIKGWKKIKETYDYEVWQNNRYNPIKMNLRFNRVTGRHQVFVTDGMTEVVSLGNRIRNYEEAKEIALNWMKSASNRAVNQMLEPNWKEFYNERKENVWVSVITQKTITIERYSPTMVFVVARNYHGTEVWHSKPFKRKDSARRSAIRYMKNHLNG
jgi:hypothetical protein